MGLFGDSKSYSTAIEFASPSSASGVVGDVLQQSSFISGSNQTGYLTLGSSSPISAPVVSAAGSSAVYLTDSSNRSVFIDRSSNVVPTISLNYGSPSATIGAPTVTSSELRGQDGPTFLGLDWKQAIFIGALIFGAMFFKKVF